MREMLLSTPVTGIFICLAAYEVGVQINKKLKNPIANPMLIGIVLAAVVLSVCNIPLEAFDLGGDMINMLLTPATAVIGLSIYRQRKVLQENFLPVVLGCLVGSLTNVALIHGLCKLFMLEDSLLPRSVTTPIAVALSEQCGGLMGVTAVCVVITGVTGAVLAPTLAKLLHFKDPVAIGVAVGTSSHAAGTTTALQMGELEGAMSGVSIGVAGLLTVLLAAVW